MPLLRVRISMPWCITLMTWPCHCDDRGANSTNSMDEPASGRFYATFVRVPDLRTLPPKSVLLVSRMAREQGSLSGGLRSGFTERWPVIKIH